jgi:hypothetical protein
MFKNFNSQNFNSQHLLIGIFIIFIVFIFLSRENFYDWNLISLPTSPDHYIPRQFILNTPANKTCPPNSTLINDEYCEYSQSIQRPGSWVLPGRCPDNYEPSRSNRTRCRAINPTTSPKLTCNNGSVLVEGMCKQQCPGTLTGDLCTFCDKGKLEGGICLSCPNNKELKNGMCY